MRGYRNGVLPRYSLYAEPKRISSSRCSYTRTKNTQPGDTLTAARRRIHTDRYHSPTDSSNASVATRSAGGRDSGKPFTAQDVRFTAKGATLHAFVMGWPEREAVIKSLASAGKVANVELLGFKGKLQWSQDEAGLNVAMPAEKPCEHAIVLKIAIG